jgi:sulfite reductase beta subunit-like hemoprotein
MRVGRDEMSDVKKFDDLPEKTKLFLSNLREDEVDTLNDEIQLVGSIKTVGVFIKWVIIGVLGIVSGVVMFAESIGKFLAWFKAD